MNAPEWIGFVWFWLLVGGALLFWLIGTVRTHNDRKARRRRSHPTVKVTYRVDPDADDQEVPV